MYYDPDGNEILLSQWLEAFEKNDRRLAIKHLTNGFVISTVWLGLDHSFGFGKPLIYETMVFKEGNYNELDMDRYSTKAEALIGHKKMVEKWRHKNEGDNISNDVD